MRKIKLALLASSMFAAFVVNAQTVTSAWSATPSSCDTGCAQAATVSVAANNNASGDVTLVYDGYLQYGNSITFTKKTFLTVKARASQALTNCSPSNCGNSQNTVSATAAFSLANNCYGSNTESNTANGNVSVSSQLLTSCVVNPGTYTLQKNGSTGVYTYYANYNNLVTITASYIE